MAARYELFVFLLADPALVEPFGQFIHVPGDLGQRAGAQAGNFVVTLGDHILMPGALAAFRRGSGRHGATYERHLEPRFSGAGKFHRSSSWTGNSPATLMRRGAVESPATRTAAATATAAGLVLRLVDLERTAAHVMAVQVLNGAG